LENYSSKKVSNNFFSITIGQTLSLFINFFSISLTARFLNVTDFGNFNYILATVVILSKFIDVGLAQIAFRETSKNKNNFIYINNALYLRIVILLIVFSLFNLFAKSFGFNFIEIILSDILFTNVIISSKFQNIRELLDIPFKVNLEMHYSMLFSNLDNLLFLVFVFLMPVFKFGLIYIILTYALSNIPGFVLALFFLKKKYNYVLKINREHWGWLLNESYPIGGFVLLVSLFQQFDVLILKNYDSAYATGIYSAATRLIIPIGIIPSALATTIFPKIVQGAQNKNNDTGFITLAYKILFFISFTLAAVITFKARNIVSFIFGTTYVDSAVPMVVLFWSYVFLFYNYFSSDIITAHNKQQFNFIYAALVVLIDLICIVFLLPHYSYVGVAIAKLIASVIGTILIIYVLFKIKVKTNFINFKIITWCAAVTISYYLLSNLQLFIYLFLSPFIALISIKVIKFFNDEELMQIFKIFNKDKWGRKFIK
jgi:O-antigen/teichoic acid export membrane protein